MTAVAMAAAPHFLARFDATWRRHLGLLVLTVTALLLLFRGDVGDLAHIYWGSTTFGHCLFILPIVGWLVWQRRAELPEVTPAAWAPGLTIVGTGALAWLLGDAAGVALARHIGLVLMLQGAIVTILGLQVTRALLFPICYLIFLVPFGEMFVPPLQALTVEMVTALLGVAGIPALVDGVLITIPNGYFEVAEACSGAKFLIAMIAYGTLVANVCFVSWRKRIGFMAMALTIPVFANGLRAWGTIYAAHLTSVEAATGMDHIVYGWVFFAVVMALVLAIGWPFFDRDPDAAWFDPARVQGRVRGSIDPVTAVAALLALACVPLLWSAAIAGRGQAVPAQIALPEVRGWERVAMSTRAEWAPHYPTADHRLIGRYRSARGDLVDLAIAVYGRQYERHEMIAFGQGAIRENDRWVWTNSLPPRKQGTAERITAPGPVVREVVTFYRVGETLTGDERAAKLATLRARLFGGPQRAVAVLVSAEERPGYATRDEISRFLGALGPIERLADRSAGLNSGLNSGTD